eukprot:5178206-Prymnesium_polylepis.1
MRCDGGGSLRLSEELTDVPAGASPANGTERGPISVARADSSSCAAGGAARGAATPSSATPSIAIDGAATSSSSSCLS